jgi:hypothetical protein
MQNKNLRKPLLVGILVDVSGSMVQQLQNERGQTLKASRTCARVYRRPGYTRSRVAR